MDIRERIISAAALKAREKQDQKERYAERAKREHRLKDFLDYLFESFKPLRGLRLHGNGDEPYEVGVSKITHQNSVMISYGESKNPGHGRPSHYRIWLTGFFSNGKLGLRVLTEPTVRFCAPHEAVTLDSGSNYLRSWWDDDEMLLRDHAKELIVEILTPKVDELEYEVNA